MDSNENDYLFKLEEDSYYDKDLFKSYHNTVVSEKPQNFKREPKFEAPKDEKKKRKKVYRAEEFICVCDLKPGDNKVCTCDPKANYLYNKYKHIKMCPCFTTGNFHNSLCICTQKKDFKFRKCEKKHERREWCEECDRIGEEKTKNFIMSHYGDKLEEWLREYSVNEELKGKSERIRKARMKLNPK